MTHKQSPITPVILMKQSPSNPLRRSRSTLPQLISQPTRSNTYRTWNGHRDVTCGWIGNRIDPSILNGSINRSDISIYLYIHISMEQKNDWIRCFRVEIWLVAHIDSLMRRSSYMLRRNGNLNLTLPSYSMVGHFCIYAQQRQLKSLLYT